MTNPFDASDAAYRVLANAEHQHSLWPDGLPVPDGWSPVFGPDTRHACVAHVDTHWSDMRPPSIRTAP
ncbi:MbtH family protein [Streptomyces alfalfae]|uniref:MbtH family protein n=1 Tax=Streptomyces alfalfae TaxID=1642299 RepID=A0A7T4PBF5_9ACTN|nr:MbtH family protein [Streptomyces alfalfae]QQC87072.1 MbtH family protein [Streptomyces alfalfae]QQC93431.1 MbtH family protein [Streptomyces alfalfae]